MPQFCEYLQCMEATINIMVLKFNNMLNDHYFITLI